MHAKIFESLYNIKSIIIHVNNLTRNHITKFFIVCRIMFTNVLLTEIRRCKIYEVYVRKVMIQST